MSARTYAYVFGYPRAVVGVVVREVVGLVIESALFVVAPAIAGWYLLTEPWRLAVSWYVVGLPLAAVLLAIAVWMGRARVGLVRERFGLRVVPQFARRMEPEPGTYYSGYRVAGRMRELDALAGGDALATFVGRDAASGVWFDAARGCATVETLLARVEPGSAVYAELSTWLAALRRAEAEGVGFRLVVVSGTTMNAMLWDRLRAAGY